jgi:integrase
VGDRSWQPKTKINRVVPISTALYGFLKDYRPRRSNTTVGGEFRGWYFPSPEGTWWDPDNFSACLRKANLAAGLTWRCLDFRHTFGSQLAQKGVSLYKIATLMGNSPEICRRHYAALIPEALTEEVEFGPPERSKTAA